MYHLYNWTNQVPPAPPAPASSAPAAPHYLVADAIDDPYDHPQPPPPPPPPPPGPGYGPAPVAPPSAAPAPPFAVDYHYQPPPPPYYAPFAYGYPQRPAPTYNVAAAPEEPLPQLAATFKPIQTKKNSKPRINKIVKGSVVSPPSSRRRAPRKWPPYVVGEVVHDDVFDHYAGEMGLARPSDATVSASCQLRLKSPHEFALFDLFSATVSPSLDVYLPHRVWGSIVPEVALYDDTNVVLDAVLCVASMVYSRQCPAPSAPEVALKYYQRAVASIRHQMITAGDDNAIMARVLVATVLLCVYETLLPPLDGSYVDGAASLLLQLARRPESATATATASGRSGRPPGLGRSPLYQSCLTMVMVCDTYQALKHEQPGSCSGERFWQALDPDGIDGLGDYDRGQSPAGAPVVAAAAEWWLQKSVHLLGAINDFRCTPSVLSFDEYECNRPLLTWRQWRRQLAEFDAQMPSAMAPIVYQWDPMMSAFPTIYFRCCQHALVYLHRHMAHLCLYEALQRRPHGDDGAAAAELEKLGPDHSRRLAREVVGIFHTYDGNGGLSMATMPCVRLVTAHLGDDELARQWMALAERQRLVGAVARTSVGAPS